MPSQNDNPIVIPPSDEVRNRILQCRKEEQILRRQLKVSLKAENELTLSQNSSSDQGVKK